MEDVSLPREEHAPAESALAPQLAGIPSGAALLGSEAHARLADQALAGSEARYRALVAATAQLVWHRHPHGAGDAGTDAWWLEVTGQSAEESNSDGGWGWLAVLHPDDRERARSAWTDAFQRRVLFDVEYRVRRRDGAYMHLAVRGVPVGGDPLAGEWIGTFTDVTASRTAELEREALVRAATAERERLLAEAESANRAKSEFLAVMSHELRTPLNAIGGYVDLLDMGIRGPITPEQRTDLQRVRTAQRTLLRHINDMLNFAKLEAGRVEFDIRDVAISELFAAVEPLMLPQAQAKSISFGCEAPAEPLVARLDPEKGTQVLLNLVANAVKFTPQGGVVKVSARADGDRVAIDVSDTGIGIPPDQLDRIFDPFVQVRPTGLARQEGTGLGLAISRDLVHGMGGELAVVSEVGVGSTFTVRLPRGAGGD